MKALVIMVALLTVLSACGTLPGVGSRGQAAGPVDGTWAGTITGLDMSTAAGPAAAATRLTIDRDGRWTLTSGGTVASGASRRDGARLVMDGMVSAGDPMTVGRAVYFDLVPRGPDTLYGRGDTFFQGRRADVGVALRRVSG